jgi:pimeloyl-ACP methyl ester carboxylesterase
MTGSPDNYAKHLHYTITGNGPVVVMLPGMGLDMHIYDTVALLMQKRFTCVQVDNLGSGASPAPRGPYRIEQMAAAVRDVLHRESLEGVSIVGHSMSGFIAVALAHLSPALIGRIVLCGSSPSGLWTKQHRDADVAQILNNRNGPSEEVIRRNLACNVTEDFLNNRGAEFDLLVEERLHHLGPGRGFAGQQAAAAQYDMAGQAALPGCPILIIHGNADRMIPPHSAGALAALFPSARVKWLDGVGHLPMLEAPARMAALLEEFIRPE